ncbi:MAG: hypothetical protein U0795_26550 [Pirellulales bacterium]
MLSVIGTQESDGAARARTRERRLTLNTQAKSGWLVAALVCGASLWTTSGLHAALPWEYLLTAQLVGQAPAGQDQVTGLVRQARQAMQRGDMVMADQLLKRSEQLAAQMRLDPNAPGDSPLKARRDFQRLVAAGGGAGRPAVGSAPAGSGPVTATITDMAEPAAGGGAGNAAPVVTRAQLGSPQGNGQAIGQVRQLMAQAHVALQQGDVATAEQLARQAVGMQVPDNMFAPQEPRPWTLLMEVNKERQRMGVAGTNGPQSPVQFAAGGGDQPTPAPTGNSLAQFDPSDSVFGGPTPEEPAAPAVAPPIPAPAPVPAPTPVRAQAAEQATPPAELPTPPARQLPADESAGTGTGGVELAPEEIVRRGLEALKARKYDEAERLLQDAWSHQAELDPASRQQVQDQLQGLRARRALTEVQPAEENLAETHPELKALYDKINEGEASIRQTLPKSPKEALNKYDELVAAVREANLDDDLEAKLLSRLKRSEAGIQKYVLDNRVQIDQDERNREVLAEIERRRQLQIETDEKLARMVDHFNELMDQQRFAEAQVIAKQAVDLAPEAVVVQNMLWQSRFAGNLYGSLTSRDRRQDGFNASMMEVDRASEAPVDEWAVEFPKNWDALTQARRRRSGDQDRNMSAAELRLRSALQEKVEVHFNQQPLSSVISTLANIAGVNVFLDPQGLAVEGLTTETPVTLDLPNEISLKSALNLILGPLRLEYFIRDEVLHVTSRQTQQAALTTEVYNVADLVIPIPNFVPTHNIGMAAALREAYNTIGFGAAGGAPQQVPLALLADRSSSSANGGNTLASSLMGQANTGSPGMPNGMPTPVGSGPGGLGGGVGADFDSLINLITTTIAPDSWEETGEGTGTIEPFPTNLSLVVTQTQEVHDQIRDLLEQLRRLQDLQVTIEVRFLTLNDNFFERIGVDFDFDLSDKTGLNAVQFFQQRGQNTQPAVTIGLDQNGQPTADLDLSFTQDSFGGALPPPFAGFDPGSAATFGFAILSDIEAFFVIQAAQGDSRTNILQAPKVTLFNGQLATVSDQTQRSYVQTVIPVVGDFAVAHQPVIMVLSEGTSLSVQAVISSDRRFVRLTLMPLFSTIDDVQEFRFEGSSSSNTGTISLDPTDNTNVVANDAQEVVTGTTIQLPTFSFTSVATTVSVPDGGTVLLGGVKRMTEGRNERGVPVLSKLPYINRLFKNVGIGRTTSSLMMMVTPRIIIQEEEEAKLGIQVPAP